MPNICDYSMKVIGREEDVNEFIEIMQNDYDCTPNEPRHFWRVFEAYEDYRDDLWNGMVSVQLSGDCAWSVHTCMTEGGYQRDHMSDGTNGTTLRAESERLNLVIEVFSEECGMGFMEHYLYAFGKEIFDICVDYHEYYLENFDSVEEFNEELNLNWTQEEFDNYEDDRYTEGGLEWDFSINLERYYDYQEEFTQSLPIREDIEEVSEVDLLNILNLREAI